MAEVSPKIMCELCREVVETASFAQHAVGCRDKQLEEENKHLNEGGNNGKD